MDNLLTPEELEEYRYLIENSGNLTIDETNRMFELYIIATDRAIENAKQRAMLSAPRHKPGSVKIGLN